MISGLSIDEQATFDGLLGLLRGYSGSNLTRLAHYEMKHRAQHLGIAIPGEVAAKLGTVLGWSAKAVDVLNSRCRLEGFSSSADLDSLGMAELMRGNSVIAESRQHGLSSLIYGTGFLVSTRGDESIGEPPVVITGKDGLSGTGSWDRRRRALSDFLSVIDVDDQGDPVEFVLYLPGVNISCRQTGSGWSVERDEHPFGVPVEPLPYRPYDRRPLGRSRITPAVMSLNAAAVRSVARSEMTAELYSVAQRLLLGVGEDAFTDSNGQPTNSLRAVFGRVWAIPRDEDGELPDVKEFSGASQQPHMDQLRSLAQMFSGETSIPLASLGISADANPTSADSYYAAREDLITEAEDTTDSWSPAWSRTMVRALAMLNDWSADEIPAEVAALAPKWRPAQYQSRAALADAGSKTIDKFPWLADSDLGLEL